MEELTVISKTSELVDMLWICRKTVQKRLKEWKLDGMFIKVNKEWKKKNKFVGYLDKKDLLRIVLNGVK